MVVDAGQFSIHIDEGDILVARIAGKLSTEVSAAFGQQLLDHLDRLKVPYRLLLDVSEALPTSAPARYQLMQPIFRFSEGWVAVVGTDPVKRALIEATARYVDITERTSYFQDTAAAWAWLDERDR